jgi:SAM-dependent methyltransferase
MVLVSDPATCPACGGSQVFAIEQWPLGKRHVACGCRDCGLLFVYPFASPEELQAFYAPGGRWSTTHGDDRVPKKRGAGRALLSALDQYFPASQPVGGASVLDFGCGAGAWLNEFQDRGWATYGIEPSTDLAFGRHQRLVTIPDEPQFDLYIAYHVLEHLPQPLDTLQRLAKALRPDGHCLISVPRVDALAAHGKIHYCLQRHNHIVAFTEACLRGLLARAGIQTLAVLDCLDRPDTPSRRVRLLGRKTTVTDPLPDATGALQRVIQDVASLMAAVRQ